MALVPARLAFAADGTPYSEEYGDVYHSADGGLEQARHVFLAGNDLPARWRGRGRFVVVETGFGMGLNFLATWAAWRDDPQRPRWLHFVSVEKHPLRRDDLARLHDRWPGLAPLAQELQRRWPPLTAGFHRLHFDQGRVTLTLLLGEALDCLRRLQAGADVFFLDGFAPARNPQLWEPSLFKALARLAAPGATLATWSVAAAVRDGLGAAGFVTDKRPGFGHKREMLAAAYRGPAREPAHAGERRAIVIGAGIAGASACERLAQRGWEVEVVERHAAPAQEASGNHAGALRPMLSRDDNIASRLSRACYLYALQRLHDLTESDQSIRWQDCGVLQLARNPEHEALQREIAARHGFPDDFVAFLEREQAAARAGAPVEAGGWLFPAGGWLNPPSLCRALLARHGERVRTRYGCSAARIEPDEQGWKVLDEAGTVLASAPLVVVAAAAEAARFAQSAALPLKRVRGQVTHLPPPVLSTLPLVLCREGYVTPQVDGIACLGASFDFDDEDPAPRLAGHAGNLARLERLLPGTSAGLDPASLAGRVGFRTATPDRLPLAGALPRNDAAVDLRQARLEQVPRWQGLYGLVGYGARGLVWAPLLAELLASQLEGEPLPLESDLVAAVDPARFLLRAHRRGRIDTTQWRAEED